MSHQDSSHDISDTFLAGGLVSAPAWAGWIAELNDVLTAITLIVGLAIGLIRLWSLLRGCRKSGPS